MTIGIFSRTFAGTDLSGVLERVRGAGYGAVHLSLASAGLDALPAELSVDLGDRLGAAVRASGVVPVGVSATFNAAHPDPRERAGLLSRGELVVERARALGTDFVSLCTGSRSSEGMWTYHPANASPEAWRDAWASLAALATSAERAGVRLGVEPERANVVSDARAARRMLDEIGSPALRIIFDGANLVGPRATVEEQHVVFEEAFKLLGPDIAVIHAKDHDADGTSVRIGTGTIDFPRVMDLVRRFGLSDRVPIVTHNLPEDQAPAAHAYLADLLSR
jgi:sugar phosphate isomerase/epimerase